jgi:hypothetical protein
MVNIGYYSHSILGKFYENKSLVFQPRKIPVYKKGENHGQQENDETNG